MLRSTLIAFYRSLARQPLYAALNVAGLASGIAVFIVISLYVRFETMYDRWLPGAGEIHELSSTLAHDRYPETAPVFMSAGVALDAIRAAEPAVTGTRVTVNYLTVLSAGQAYEQDEHLVDHRFFDVFAVPLAAGNAQAALRTGAMAISEDTARKYFGRTDVIGRTLTLRDMGYGTPFGISAEWARPRSYVIAAVMKDAPANASLRFNVVRLMEPGRRDFYPYWNDWGARQHRTFLRLSDQAQVQRINARMDHIVDSNGMSDLHATLAPDTARHTVHVNRFHAFTAGHFQDGKTVAMVVTLSVFGVVALLLAMVNYANLATARAGLRAREAAVRQAMGATARDLRIQFLTEAVAVSLLALVLGLSVVELVLPLLNRAGGLALHLDYGQDWGLLLALSCAVVATGAVSGLYPALVVSAFQPARVLAAVRHPAGGRLNQRVREGLAALQFAVVTGVLILVTGFAAQLHHMQTSDLGFRRDGLLVSNAMISASLPRSVAAQLQDGWRALPGVKGVTGGVVPGAHFPVSVIAVSRSDRPQATAPVRMLNAQPDFFRVYGTPLLAGRGLQPDDAFDKTVLDKRAATEVVAVPVVVNSAAVEVFGFASPQAAVGKAFTYMNWRYVIAGVVADQRFAAPSQPVVPSLYYALTDAHDDWSTIVRYEGVAEDVMKARMRAVWTAQVPDLPFDITSVEAHLDHYYISDRRLTRLFAAGAIMVALIGVAGLYGMAAFNTSARTVEIGLRKAMGASRWAMAGRLVARALRPVLLANLAAWPVAYLILRHWLGQFDDRVGLSLWFFATGSGAALVIALLTIGGLSLAAAGRSPARALRNE